MLAYISQVEVRAQWMAYLALRSPITRHVLFELKVSMKRIEGGMRRVAVLDAAMTVCYSA